jgi:hypothetical protein
MSSSSGRKACASRRRKMMNIRSFQDCEVSRVSAQDKSHSMSVPYSSGRLSWVSMELIWTGARMKCCWVK